MNGSLKSTPVLALAVLVAVVLAVAARREPVMTAPVYEPVASPGAGLDTGDGLQDDSDATTISGEVSETFDVAQYTYLRLATPSGETWAAVSKAPVLVGTRVQVNQATRMENFTSNSLKRTFPVIYFGELSTTTVAGLPAGHPPLAGSVSPHAAEQSGGPIEEPAVAVPRAVGKNGRTIAELYGQRASLQGQLVRVRGRVTKVTSAVLGKNYVRLRDGSSTGAARTELVLTTRESVAVGAVISCEGTLNIDVDLGIGSKYPVLLEDAVLLREP